MNSFKTSLRKELKLKYESILVTCNDNISSDEDRNNEWVIIGEKILIIIIETYFMVNLAHFTCKKSTSTDPSMLNYQKLVKIYCSLRFCLLGYAHAPYQGTS